MEDTDLDAIVNQLRFLQTIDTDNNPGNGITLPTINSVFTVNFKQRIEDFSLDPAVTVFLNTYAARRSLISIQAAVEHFNNSIQTVTSGTVLELTGKTARSVITNTNCTNNIQAGWTYSFEATRVAVEGSDGFDNNNGVCTNSPSERLEENNADIPQGEFLHGLPSLTYKEINYIIFRTADVDGRTTVEMSWHTPGTNVIRYIKRILVAPNNPGQPVALSTFKETIRID